jgi:Uma2 family endonuclease
MSATVRFTSADLEYLPHADGKRYEIIDGELYVSRAPGWEHQYSGGQVFLALQIWSLQTGLGVAACTPGLVFSADDDVIPDVIWMSRTRRAQALDERRHLRLAPELVVEVLSPGTNNVKRDRDVKLKLYSRQGVLEYWIVDWRTHSVQIYRRENAVLRLISTLYDGDALTSPLLPDFSCLLETLWEPPVQAEG